MPIGIGRVTSYDRDKDEARFFVGMTMESESLHPVKQDAINNFIRRQRKGINVSLGNIQSCMDKIERAKTL